MKAEERENKTTETRQNLEKEVVEICEKFGLEWNEAAYLVDFIFIHLTEKGIDFSDKIDNFGNGEV